MITEKELLQQEYQARINKAFDYIEKNISNNFSLDELAEVANFSKYHFSRIFQSLIGETPFKFIQRVRLERAAMLLGGSIMSVSEVSTNCGFSDISIFSRNFKNHFKITPTEYRNKKQTDSNNSKTQSNNSQYDAKPTMYFCFSSNKLKWKTNMEQNKGVEIKEFPKMTVAYVRYTGPYAGDENLFESLWNKLFAWAGPRNLMGNPDFKLIAMYHDDPNITDEEKLRTSLCIGVPANTKVDGDIGKMDIEGGTYAVASFELNGKQFAEAWQWVYSEWLPQSGYQPDDKAPFEMYPKKPENNIYYTDICIPVKPL